MLVEFNQKGFHRRGATEMGLRISSTWVYREEAGKALQARKGHEKEHVCLGSGWAQARDCGKSRVPGKQQRTAMEQNRTE